MTNPITLPAIITDNETGIEIGRTIDTLSPETNLLTRLRLQGTRGKLALELAQTALVKHMEARRSLFVYEVAIAEDQARKQLLKQSLQGTAATEQEIARIIADTVEGFGKLAFEREEAAWKRAMSRAGEIKAAFEIGQISERGYERMLDSIDARVEREVEEIDATTREILANLKRRFDAALKQVTGGQP